jgi:hypothetical protein
MFEYNAEALKKVEGIVSFIRPTQIDMAYWRKTPLGLPFEQTIACLGGWVCLMGVFKEEGLQLVWTDPTSEFGYVPAIKGQGGMILRGYAAMGFVLQKNPSNDTAARYGRNIFALNGGGEFDKYLPRLTDAKSLTMARINYARKVHLINDPVVI